jgi:hypothetical protein
MPKNLRLGPSPLSRPSDASCPQATAPEWPSHSPTCLPSSSCRCPTVCRPTRSTPCSSSDLGSSAIPGRPISLPHYFWSRNYSSKLIVINIYSFQRFFTCLFRSAKQNTSMASEMISFPSIASLNIFPPCNQRLLLCCYSDITVNPRDF